MFKIGSVEELLSQIILKMKIHLDAQSLNSNIYSNLSIHDILEADMYGRGLGCVVSFISSFELNSTNFYFCFVLVYSTSK